MITCTKKYTGFPAAHRQPIHEGHCRFIHGHNFSFEFDFVAKERDDCGFVMDFGRLGPLKEWLTSMFDHTLLLNDNDPLLAEDFMEQLMKITTGLKEGNVREVPNCSAEGLADYCLNQARKIVKEITGNRVAVTRCTVWEDEKNSATAYI